MYKIISEEIIKEEFETLAQAIEFSTKLGKFVTITGGELDIVGIFGVDSVALKDYAWKKRRI